MASALKAAQDASAASPAQQSQAQEDVVMLSAEPIMVTNSQDQEAAESALFRTEVALSEEPIMVTNSQDQEAAESALLHTEVALSERKVSSHDDGDSVVKLALKSRLANSRMDVSRLSDDVKYFMPGFESSGGSLDLRGSSQHLRIDIGSSSMMLSSSSFSSIMCFRFLESKTQLMASTEASSESGRFNLSHDLPHCGSQRLPWFNIRESHHQQHDHPRSHARWSSWSLGTWRVVRHQVAQLASTRSGTSSSVIIHGWDRDLQESNSSFREHQVGPQCSCRIMFYSMSVSIWDRYVTESLTFVVNHMTARWNERVHSLMRNYHPHLLGIFFSSSSG